LGELGDVVRVLGAVLMEPLRVRHQPRRHPPDARGGNLGSAATSSGFTVDLWKRRKGAPDVGPPRGVSPRRAPPDAIASRASWAFRSALPGSPLPNEVYRIAGVFAECLLDYAKYRPSRRRPARGSLPAAGSPTARGAPCKCGQTRSRRRPGDGSTHSFDPLEIVLARIGLRRRRRSFYHSARSRARSACAWRSMFTRASASPYHRVRPRRARASELAPVDALDRDGQLVQ
jgi:hypothetical protein